MKTSVRTRPPLVVVLHGLARRPASMATLSRRIAAAGFEVRNVGYRSTEAPLDALVSEVRGEIEPVLADAPAVHFVTYSMGGIVVRRLLAGWRPIALGRVVMIAPPNQGSEIVDALRGRRVVRWLYGPVFKHLGTTPDSVPNRLGPVEFETGVIAGSRVVSPLGWWLMQAPSDGTVSVERTRVAGMRDHIVLPHSHTFIMDAPRVADEAVHFLQHGRFTPDAPRRL
jgi:hypothetical protein